VIGRRTALLVIAIAGAAMAVFASAATLGVSSARIDTFDSASPASTTTTTTGGGDTTKPVATGAEFFDVNTVDGKIDRVVVTYDEALDTFTGVQSDWTLNASRPTGMAASPTSVSVSGGTVILDWTTGLSTNAATAAAGLTVSLSNPNAVRDLAGNAAVASTTPVIDKAAPYATTLQYFDTGSTGDGRVDRIQVTFSEAIDAYSAPASVWTMASTPALLPTNPATVTAPTGGTLVTLDFTSATNLNTGPTVALSLAPNAAGIRDAAGNLSSFTNRSVDDKAKPVFGNFSSYRDANANGRVDQLYLRFSEPIVGPISGTSWTLFGGPGGMQSSDIGTPTLDSGIVVLPLSETNGTPTAQNTHFTGLSVTLNINPGSTGVRDAAGNPANHAISGSVGTDEAGPVLISVGSSNLSGGGVHKPEVTDAIQLNFSESLGTVPAVTGVTFARDSGNNRVTTMAVAGLFTATNLSPDLQWWGKNNAGSTTFAASRTVSGSQIVITLGSCGGCALSDAEVSVSATMLTTGFAWVTAPRDAALITNAAPVHTVAPTGSMF
jgi:hypothetical protein